MGLAYTTAHVFRPEFPPAMRASTTRTLTACLAVCLGIAGAGCTTSSRDVRPLLSNPRDFSGWDCERLDAEALRVQRRAAEVAYAVDERAGTNIIALGVGLTVFWPALLTMRQPGVEAEELARLKGRFDVLQAVAVGRQCPSVGPDLPARQALQLPVALGERLVYEERGDPRLALREFSLRLDALRREVLEFTFVSGSEAQGRRWVQDFAGNVTGAPVGTLHWPHLLRLELGLGQVVAGDLTLPEEPGVRARVRGQVVAVGPQTIATRRFDAAVIELFGDAQRGERSTRVDGVMVVDRASGVLLRLELSSAQAGFNLQRRLVRIDAPAR
jgi:hypothetical protein